MNNQKLNNILKDPNTNWKYIAIVAIVGLTALSGILVYQNFWPASQDISLPKGPVAEEKTPEKTPEILETPEQPQVPTGWKTYRNEKYGFEFQYPAAWIIKDNIGGPRGGYPIIALFDVYPFDAKEGFAIYFATELLGGKSIQEHSRPLFCDVGECTEIDIEEREISIGRKNGIWQKGIFGTAGPSIRVFFPFLSNGTFVIYSFGTPDGIDIRSGNETIFDQILSTFRFLE